MKKVVKCEKCEAEVTADGCVFATYKRRINGEEYTFCCSHCADKFQKDQ
jgi:YHS domain-containing protein